MADTIAAGAGLCDEPVARRIVDAAPAAVEHLARLGVAFDRRDDGSWRLGLEAAHGRKRIVHATGDGTGREIMRALIAAVRRCPSITLLEGFEARRLLVEDNAIRGVLAANERGALVIDTNRVVIATGGIGGLFLDSTNPAGCFGQGLALAAHAGATLSDLEFIQFHPTAFDGPSRPMPLLTEAIRGDGAILIDDTGTRFMADEPGAELAPRDIVARAVWRRRAEGHRTYLDARKHPGPDFARRFPVISAFCRMAGIDPVTDPIPVGLTVTAINAPGWTCNSVPASSISCSRSDALAAGATYPDIVLTVAIDSGVTGEVENTSTVSGGGDSDLSDNTSSSTNPVTNVADLALTKTASKDSVTIGENFTYALKVTNNGPSKATSVAITDDLPAGLSFVSATPAPGCSIQPISGTLGCAVGTLNAGASYTVTVTVHVDGSANGTLHNTATVGAQQTDPNPGNNSGSDDVDVLGADLQVTKVKKSPATVVTGNTVVYEIKVKNLGPSNATGVVLTDALPAGLTNVTTNQGACTVAAPNVSCVVGNLASGATWTVEVSGKVTVGTTILTNHASATGNEIDPDLSNNQDEVTTPVGKSADLSIVKNSDPAEVVAGGNLFYTFAVSNAGPDEATGIVITDTLPAGLTYVDGAPGCSAAGQVVTCSVNPIAAGGSRQTGITVSVSPTATGVITNSAHVTGNENDPDPSNNDDSVDTPVKASADVQIVKTASPTNPVPGDTVTYTLKAKNNGPDPAGNVVVTDVLPAGVSFISADAPCTQASGTVTCVLGTLAAGQEVDLEVKVKVDHWGDTDPSADHLLDVQKVENQIDLNPGEQKTIQVTCPSGYFASDGSVRVDHIDQGTGDWTAPQVLENRASSLDTWQGTVRNTAAGRAQAKIFAVCIRKTTGNENGHSHNLLVSDPITVTTALIAGKTTRTLQCGPGQVAIQPGFISTVAGQLVYSQPEGNGWKFVYDASEGGSASFSIRCLTRQVEVDNGHTHDLKLERIATEVEIAPGTVNEAQLTCADGSKGIVAGWDLDDGLVSLGNDPRPVTRAFKLYNPTDHTLKARLTLLCLGLRTGGERAPAMSIINTANISTSSSESDIGNNGSSAGINVDGIEDTPIVPVDPTKPHPNNPIAKTIVGKGVSYSASGVTFTLKCSGACGGTAKLTSIRKVKVGGKKYGKGTVLAARQYFVGKAGTRKVTLRLTDAGRKIIKSGKSKKALLRISGGTRKVVKVGRR